MTEAPGDMPVLAAVRAGRGSFILTVIAVYVATLWFPQRSFTFLESAVLLAAGVAYLLLGIAGTELYSRSGSRLVLAALYAIEIPLGGLIVYWTAGFFLSGLIMLPLAGLSVQLLSRRQTALVCVLLVAALTLSYGLPGGVEAALLAGVGYLAGIVFVVLVTRIAVREREARAEVERLAAELTAANRQLREYTAQAEELAVTRERARLASELHDSVGHALTALNVQLELLARLPSDQAEQRQQAAVQARALVKQGLGDVRRAVQALRPAALETFSLPEAVAGLVAGFEEAMHIHAAWQVEGKVTPLPPRLAVPLYRAVQEALTNIQRHAPSARHVAVGLRYEAEAVSVSVENDGLSFGLVPRGEGGYGLRGLGERARALGGSFAAGPEGEGVFRLEMSLPLT